MKNKLVTEVFNLVVEGCFKKTVAFPVTWTPRGRHMNRWNEMTNTECSDGRVPVGRSHHLCVYLHSVWLSSTCFPMQPSSALAPPCGWVWGPPRTALRSHALADALWHDLRKQMLRLDRKWPTSEALMEKKLFVSVTENSEEVTVQQETANNTSQASVWFEVGDWKGYIFNP